MMKKIFTLLMAVALFVPLLSQEPVAPKEPEAPEATEAEAAEAAAAAAAAQEAPEAPEAPETPETPEEGAQVSEDEAVDQAIDEAIGESSKEWNGDTTNVIGRVEVIEASDKTRVTIGSNEVIIVEENGDSVVVGLGKRGLSIVEDGDGVKITVMDMDEKRSAEAAKRRRKKFKPHYAGLSVGLNNYLTPSGSMVLPPEDQYMDLNTGKSWNWNINFLQLGVGLGTQYVGLVTGMSFEFINYHFNYQNSVIKDPDTGVTGEYVPDYAGYISKSKLFMTYLTVPLLLEFHIPTDRGPFYISGGVIGGLKLCSHTKMVYRISGDKSKDKNRSDFNISPFRWGFTARVGYKWIGLYFNYYMTPLFRPTMGPELQPFAAGLAFTF